MANHLKSQCYSLVIGFNLLGSLVMSAIMTFFFVQFNVLEITVPGRVSKKHNIINLCNLKCCSFVFIIILFQFLFIGGLYSVLGTMFLIIHFFDVEKSKNTH